MEHEEREDRNYKVRRKREGVVLLHPPAPQRERVNGEINVETTGEKIVFWETFRIQGVNQHGVKLTTRYIVRKEQTYLL